MLQKGTEYENKIVTTEKYNSKSAAATKDNIKWNNN